tara:strand:+ start:503 stop:679 length:177 start_codon:yes stop_codon:yes gene_type:complete
MTDFGSRIKNKQKSLAGATNYPIGIGNASLIGWFILLIQAAKNTSYQEAFCRLRRGFN